MHEVEITFPRIFPECSTCPVVIREFENVNTRILTGYPYKSKLLSVTITCDVDGQKVQMSHKSTRDMQLNPRGRVVRVDGGSRNPKEVKCPHFG